MSPIDQKRIARNTLLLYIRMGIIMLVSLYTSRVILDALGEVDMGIYSTAGGIVLMFAFLSNTMATACQRFYAVALGRDDHQHLQRVFSMCVSAFIILAGIIILICETAGTWLLNDKITVDGRMHAAVWVFQSAIVSFVFTILRMPYQGMVIIREKMKVFAYISIFEALGNLAIALLIAHTGADRLILYSLLMLAINIGVTLYYILYCTHFYQECKYRFFWDGTLFKEIFSFAGWNMIGSLSSVCKSHGITILLNVFFGNAIVAARTMAYKVYSTIQQFADNFFTAMRPQIMKSWAAGDKEGTFKLVFQGSKFSYFLLYIISLPILLEAPLILDVWLKDVPDMTVLFTRLVVINALIEVFVSPLATAMQAYGNIRNYQLICGGFILLILPVAYLFLKLGYPAETVFWVSIIICALAVVLRIVLIHHYMELSIRQYARRVTFPVILVTAISAALPIWLEHAMMNPILRFCTVSVTSVFMVALAVWTIGLTRTERIHLKETINTYLHKLHNGRFF